MPTTTSDPVIAYLAPALTALEATFVYNELLALENLSVRVVPVSIHRPIKLLIGHDELLGRTIYLYEHGVFHTIAKSLWAFVRLPLGHKKGLSWLLSDVMDIGVFRLQAWKLIYQYVVAARLADILIQKRCRHLHVHFAHVPAQIAMYASAISGVPFTITAHANDIFERGLLLRQKAQRAAKMLTISEHNKAYLERVGIPKDRLAVVRCGVQFSERDIKPTYQRQNIYRVGTLGRLVEKKGMDVLIRALTRVNASHKVELEIAGDGPLRGELEQLAIALGVSANVRFVGNLPHREVQKWMHGLHLFALACKPDANGDMDGIPLVLMEAMSQSIPVVSTRLSGIAELVIHGTTGLLATPGDSDDLAMQIVQLLESPELRRKLAQKGLDHVQEEFGQAVNLQRLMQYFSLSFYGLGIQRTKDEECRK